MDRRFALRLLQTVAAAALIRRAIDISQYARRCQWERRTHIEHSSEPHGLPVTVIVPVFDEATVVPEMVDHWATTARAVDGLDVRFVTTVKEANGPASTHAALEKALGAVDEALAMVRAETVHRFRCVQLDVVLNELGSAVPAPERSQHWIGVYNADSKPEPATFAELTRRARADVGVRAYQQRVRYYRPATRPSPWYMSGFPAYQTWWTDTRYFARQQRGLRQSWWGRVSPYSTFGHGEFLRLDLALEMGGFPNYAYADGLLLGWELRAAKEPIGLLAARDWAETPRSIRHVLLQHRAWMRGLLNAPDVFVRSRPGLPNRLSRTDRRTLAVAHTVVVALWGLRPVVAAVCCWSLVRLYRQNPAKTIPLVGAFVTYLAVPAIAYALPSSHPIASVNKHVRREQIVGLVASAAVVTLIDGAAFPMALYDRVLGDGRAPRKTPR